MVDAQLAATQAAIEAAIKSGALIHHRVALEEGEWEQRSLWLRPEVNDLVSIVIGGPFTVVKAGSPHGEASNLGDIKELQGPPPPFVELRFKPPKHQLRIFGRFIRKDGLILMSFGMKSRAGTTGMKPLLIPNERRRCDSFFSARSVKLEWVPNPIENSLSNATFV